jgi:hypothetical protein
LNRLRPRNPPAAGPGWLEQIFVATSFGGHPTTIAVATMLPSCNVNAICLNEFGAVEARLPSVGSGQQLRLRHERQIQTRETGEIPACL